MSSGRTSLHPDVRSAGQEHLQSAFHDSGSTGGTVAEHGRYRPEIDGVRAIAVMSVMLFHAGVPGIAGGFLGVDVFFVISGFLITGQIATSAMEGRFSIADFYMRRIRRIIPALAVMCLLTIPLAYWLMLPDDLENYGQSLVATGTSANNILLFLTSNYFSLETLYKPLIHTWSLGVEEQYYVIVPIMLALAIRFSGAKGAFACLLVVSAISFCFAILIGQVAPALIGKNSVAFNFYLLPSRFWELGIGGIAVLARPRLLKAVGAGKQQAIAAVGIAVAVASIFAISEDPSLPGWPTLFPVFGTAAFLVFGDTTGAGRLLAAGPMRWLGLISYSTYLYHQPVFAFYRIASLDEPSWPHMAATIPLVLALGWTSWRFVERPFRNPVRCPAWRVLAFSGIGTSISIAVGVFLHFTSGLYYRWPELAQGDSEFGARQNATYVDRPYALNHKPFASPDRQRNVLVVGDSFGRDFINMAWETRTLDRYTLSYTYGDLCNDAKVQEELRARALQAGSVIIATWFVQGDEVCLARTVQQLKSLGVRNVVVLGTKNFGFNNNAIMRLPADVRYTYRVKPLANIVADNAAARAAIPPANYMDILGMLDDGTGTVPVFTPDHKFISQDRRHLTKPGARYIGAMLFAQPQFAWVRR